MIGVKTVSVYLVFILLSLFALFLYIIGGARYLTKFEENTCEMTYMFEYPQYVKISISEEEAQRYPRYGLYAYGEGFVTERHRKMKFSGIPVLFVPGNGGSHEQVRSVASVSLRKSIKDRTPFHFDFFTVSLGKDYSALYGGVLQDETDYVSLCIEKITTLYKDKVDGIILIGHSMGGIVAKRALMRSSAGKEGNRSVASVLLTLASPHRPIFLPDRTLAKYYEELESESEEFSRMETSLVSIGGGQRDVLVSTAQTIDSSAELNLLSSGMPDVWRSTDHLCILWCKQLVLTIVRALFDCVDAKKRPPIVYRDAKHKSNALSYHFTSRSSGKRYRLYQPLVEFEGGAEWVEDPRKQYTWSSHLTNSNITVFLMFGIDSQAHDTLSLDVFNLESKDWLFACSASEIEGHSRVCKRGWNLGNLTRLAPDSLHRLRKKAEIDLRSLRGSKSTHVVLMVPGSEIKAKKASIEVHVDLYRGSDRSIRMKSFCGGLFDLFRLSSVLTPNPCASFVAPRGSLAYRVNLDGIRDAVSVEIEPIVEGQEKFSTRNGNDDLLRAPKALLEVFKQTKSEGGRPIGGEISLMDLSETGRKERAILHLTGSNESLLMSLGGEFAYRVTVQRAGLIERVACSVRERWPILYPIIVALCLLATTMRLDGSPRRSSLTWGFTFLLALVLDCFFESLVAVGLLYIFTIGTAGLVISYGSVARRLVGTLVFTTITAIPSMWFDWVMGCLDRVPLLISFFLLSLISATCGAIAILLSVVFFFIQLTRMYDDCLEELLMSSLGRFIPFRRSKRRSTADSREEVRAQEETKEEKSNEDGVAAILDSLVVFCLWSFAAIPAIPSALVWAHNFRYEMRLSTEDPIMFDSWVVLTCWGFLGLAKITRNCSSIRSLICSSIFRLAAWILMITACSNNSAHYQWIVPPLVALCVTCLSILRLLPGEPSQNDIPSITDSTEAHSHSD